MPPVRFTNITPRTKSFLVVGITLFPLILVFFFLLLVVYLPTFHNMNQVVMKTMNEILPMVELENALLRAAMPPNDFLIHGNTDEREEFKKLAGQVETLFQQAIQFNQLGEYRKQVEQAQKTWTKARVLGEKLLQSDGGTSVSGEVMEVFDATIEETIDQLFPIRQAIFSGIVEQHRLTMRLKHKGYYISLVAFFLALVGGIAASILFTLDRRQLKQMSYIDELTGLHNRRSFDKKMDYVSKNSINFEKPNFSLLMLDIDHFKEVNDTYGHDIGDVVLREVADVIKENIRSSDFASRYGGEEFALIIHSGRFDEVSRLAERIRKSVEDKTILVDDERTLRITVSIGCAFFPEDTPLKEKLFQCADQALYAAKRGGRNRVVHYSHVHKQPGDDL